ncbi:MAG TPA: alpha-amylase family glycosyl hydrolase [Ktedonobacteraceae bacterium]|nr:alpha-amylase family glycosyl hydrolase [Ktedonobacteraceae bacterium]
MSSSIYDADARATLNGAQQQTSRVITLDQASVEVPPPFASPEDWRDSWIYFLMLDRFNNPAAPPRHMPYDSIYDGFQGGSFNGVRQQLLYIKELGAGAIWISPVLKNAQYSQGSYHGYGIQDFLRVEPRFASSPDVAERELRALVDEAHRLGLYVIFDIVLNHTGDVFAYQCSAGDTTCQGSQGSEASFSSVPYAVAWRDEHGAARQDWPVGEATVNPPLDATVWPVELRRNEFFRRQGLPQSGGDQTTGDFASLKQMLTADPQLQVVLILAYQLLIAKYDADAFRIDTLKYIDRGFAREFGNAMREYALSIGKKNFFTFGEVYDDEEKITAFIGRDTVDTEAGDIIGIDAALDFPLFYRLPSMCKGMLAPMSVVSMYEHRKQVEHDIISTHGDASNYFVTFLDNHDQTQRFYYSPADNPHGYDDQLTLGVACLFCLQGIPCLYYGSEQGLHGSGNVPEAVREAMWGKLSPFDQSFAFYQAIKNIARARDSQPALRYGRLYFRPISGNGTVFSISQLAPGVLAFSRILSNLEVVVVANTTMQSETLAVIVDDTINAPGDAFQVLFSNKATFTAPAVVQDSPQNTTVQQIDGTVDTGSARYMTVTLQAMEVQILGK